MTLLAKKRMEKIKRGEKKKVTSASFELWLPPRVSSRLNRFTVTAKTTAFYFFELLLLT